MSSQKLLIYHSCSDQNSIKYAVTLSHTEKKLQHFNMGNLIHCRIAFTVYHGYHFVMV